MSLGSVVHPCVGLNKGTAAPDKVSGLEPLCKPGTSPLPRVAEKQPFSFVQNCFIYYEPSCAESGSECLLCECGFETDLSGACIKRPPSDPAYCSECQPNGACGSCGPGYRPDGPLCIPVVSSPPPAGRRGLLSEGEGSGLPLRNSFSPWTDSGRQVPAAIKTLRCVLTALRMIEISTTIMPFLAQSQLP